MDKSDTFINYTIDIEATGKNIRNLMRITGYSARELERLIGCTQMTFFNWQEGKNLPSFDNLLRLAGILKTPMEKIVVFKKFTVEELPLKDTNSGFVRNNVFLPTIVQQNVLSVTVSHLKRNSAFIPTR